MSRENRFFLYSAIVMALVNIAGFSVQLAMGRSSFGAPPIVHAHAFVFFAWVMIYLSQNVLATTGSIALHRRLGRIAAVWTVLMVVLGITLTVIVVRRAAVPFFFTPAYFVIMNPLGVIAFAGLVAAGIAMRRRTQWHRRLIYCGMAMIMGPALGRLLPVPLVIPFAGWAVFAAMLLFPLAGVACDLRLTGRVHPAWWWGIGVMIAVQMAIQAIASSPLGLAIYAAVAAHSPGAAIAPFAYPRPPWLS